jgi:hypothetical protein
MSATGLTEDGKKRQVDLNYAVTKLWPTPMARDHKSIHASPETMMKNSRPLSEVVSAGLRDPESYSENGKSPESLRLNHKWVAQLMGFPSDWFDGIERQR